MYCKKEYEIDLIRESSLLVARTHAEIVGMIKPGVSSFLVYIDSGGDRDALGNFLAWSVKKNDVRSVAFQGTWYDIGGLESYREAQTWLSN